MFKKTPKPESYTGVRHVDGSMTQIGAVMRHRVSGERVVIGAFYISSLGAVRVCVSKSLSDAAEYECYLADLEPAPATTQEPAP